MNKDYTDPQLTKDQAIALYDSGEWKQWTPEQLFHFQWNQKFLCVPFGEFHKAAEHVLGRPVWTHEFAYPEHIQEELDNGEKPSFADIVGLLPSGKTLLVSIGDQP